MTRTPSLSSPFLLGFDDIERALDRVSRSSSDGYPPYNIERLPKSGVLPERLRITFAVAGFTRDQLEVTLEERRRVFRLTHPKDNARGFFPRRTAARQSHPPFPIGDRRQSWGGGTL